MSNDGILSAPVPFQENDSKLKQPETTFEQDGSRYTRRDIKEPPSRDQARSHPWTQQVPFRNATGPRTPAATAQRPRGIDSYYDSAISMTYPGDVVVGGPPNPYYPRFQPYALRHADPYVFHQPYSGPLNVRPIYHPPVPYYDSHPYHDVPLPPYDPPYLYPQEFSSVPYDGPRTFPGAYRPHEQHYEHKKFKKSSKVPQQSAANVSMNPGQPETITIHCEYSLYDDLEASLDSFARFCREGRFKNARHLYRERLEHFIGNSYVRLQYAQGLLAMSDYKTLQLLSQEYPPKPQEGAVELCWFLLLLVAQDRSELDIANLSRDENAANVSQQIQKILASGTSSTNSTELYVLIYTISADLPAARDIDDTFKSELLSALVTEGRLWEFKDFLQTIVDVLRYEVYMGFISGSPKRSGELDGAGLNELHRALSEQKQDECGSFAILAIFSILAQNSLERLKNPDLAKACLDICQEYVKALLSSNKSCIKTEPYFRWSLARIAHEEYQDSKLESRCLLTKQLATLPGETVSSPNQLPVYGPARDEMPEWRPGMSGSSPKSLKTKKMILEAATELGNIPLQVTCLQELIYQSPLPACKDAVDQLETIHLTLGDIRSYRRLLLFKFLLPSEITSKDQLRKDILLGEPFHSYEPLFRVQCKVLAALTTGSHEKQRYLEIAGHFSLGAASKPEPKPELDSDASIEVFTGAQDEVPGYRSSSASSLNASRRETSWHKGNMPPKKRDKGTRNRAAVEDWAQTSAHTRLPTQQSNAQGVRFADAYHRNRVTAPPPPTPPLKWGHENEKAARESGSKNVLLQGSANWHRQEPRDRRATADDLFAEFRRTAQGDASTGNPVDSNTHSEAYPSSWCSRSFSSLSSGIVHEDLLPDDSASCMAPARLPAKTAAATRSEVFSVASVSPSLEAGKDGEQGRNMVEGKKVWNDKHESKRPDKQASYETESSENSDLE